MTRFELIDAIYDELGGTIEKRKIRAVVKTIFNEITESLARGERVEFRGFGNFRVRHIKERTGRNPSTGETVELPEQHYPKFRTGRTLRNRLNPELRNSLNPDQQG